MPAAQSKEAPRSQAEQDAKDAQLVRLFGSTTLLTVLGGTMLFTARQAVAKNSGLFADAASQTLFLTRIASVGAAFEFLINPVFGKLTDAHGRKPYLIGSALPMIFVRALTYLYSKMMFPLVLEELVTIPLTTVYFSTFRAALADCLDATGLTKAGASIGIWAGVGVVGGPILASSVMRRADPKWCFLLAALLNGLSITMLGSVFKETLAPEERKPLVFSDMQPLSFLQLMKDRIVNRLMLTTALQSFTEGRSINEVYVIYMLNNLKWNWSEINYLVGMSGMALILSGFIAKPMLDAMGMRKFTTFNNTCNSLSLLAYSAMPPFHRLATWTHMHLGVLFAAPAGRKRDAVESLITKIGQDRGFGNGFISSSMNNFRAIPNVLGPLVLGSAYAWGAKRQKPWVPFLVGVLSILAGELFFASLSSAELGLDDKGQLVKKAEGKPKAADKAA